MRVKTDSMSTEVKNSKKISWVDILLVAALCVWTFYVNRRIRISGLYMDDLYMWSCYGEQTFREYVLPFGSTRFRPVYWLACWLELRAIGTNLGLIVTINLVILSLIGIRCYFLMKRLSASRLIAFALSAVLVTSRFSYYDVSQMLGLLESMAMIFAIETCMQLYDYMDDRKSSGLWLASLFYLLVCFTHERYLVLLPVFYYVLIVSGEKKIGRYLLPFFNFLIIMAIRLIMTGKIVPSGTGGTEVTETFVFWEAVDSFIAQLRYLVGINDGPEHLNGIPWDQTPQPIRLVVYAGIIVLLIFAVIFAARLLSDVVRKKNIMIPLRDTAFFVLCIGLCIACSSVTIRVEMRWIYVSLCFACFMAARMAGYIAKAGKINGAGACVLLVALSLCFLCEDMYYRTGWDKIYLFPNQARYNSLADVTYGELGDRIFGKTIYIVGNSYEMSDFTGRTFFKTFDPERKAEGTTVVHVDTKQDLPPASEDVIFLEEVPEDNAFRRLYPYE